MPHTNDTVTPTDTDDRHFGGTAASDLPVDLDELRHEVQVKYAAVATDPDDDYHFHTGRPIAERCRYDAEALDGLPPEAIESFPGVANPFELRDLAAAERVVDLGSGAGMDSFLAANAVGPDGYVVGVDMTPAMLTKARAMATAIELDDRMEFCEATWAKGAEVAGAPSVYEYTDGGALIFNY
ncbi:MAG: methyltransferase domain-containing protein [Actinomycetota bacterium]